ncbi:Flavin reductase like domain protein [compost metagenome]
MSLSVSIEPSTISERENYKLLIGSVIPRPIAFVTSMSENGVLNGAPFSYFNIVSSNPPMISLSIQRKGGQLKDTARNIAQKGQFVVHVVDEHNVGQINMTAASLPSEQSEIQLAGLTAIDSTKYLFQELKKQRFEWSAYWSIP